MELLIYMETYTQTYTSNLDKIGHWASSPLFLASCCVTNYPELGGLWPPAVAVDQNFGGTLAAGTSPHNHLRSCSQDAGGATVTERLSGAACACHVPPPRASTLVHQCPPHGLPENSPDRAPTSLRSDPEENTAEAPCRSSHSMLHRRAQPCSVWERVVQGLRPGAVALQGHVMVWQPHHVNNTFHV